MASPADIAQQHLDVYEALYQEMGPNNRGLIGAVDAAAFLKRSGLPIWELADRNKTGFLDRLGAFLALKLVAAQQQGFPLSPAAFHIPLMPPVFPTRASTTGTPTVEQGGFDEMPDRAKYEAIFDSLGPIDGKLSGEKVRPVLLKSGLSPPVLGKIWELADLDADGLLDREEMCLALHLVYRALQNEPVPNVLPANLIPITRRRASRVLAGGVPVLPLAAQGANRSRAASMASLDVDSASATPTHALPPGGFRASENLQTPPTATMPGDASLYSRRFLEADTDHDGLVSGADVMGMMLSSGLPQAQLAQIWARVDTERKGALNCQQFVIAMQMIDEALAGSAAINRRISVASTRSTGNKDIDAMQAEIDRLSEERRSADAAVVQLEADMTVKQSEIKNLQIELNTLESTVAQLERQKIEANKRLGELDNQRDALRESLRCLEEKVESEQERCAGIRADNHKSSENAKIEEEELRVQKAALRALQEEQRVLEARWRAGNEEMESAVANFTQLEREVEKSAELEVGFKADGERLLAQLSRLETLLAAQDTDTIKAEQLQLLAPFQLRTVGATVAQPAASSAYYDRVPSTVDPFASHDASIPDPFLSSDPFSSAGPTPFDDPFSSTSDAFAKAPGKAPPRPAPPKNKAQTPTADPFGGQAASGDVDGFADFSRAFN